ncbi:MAG: sigma-70 family RNA polymerase sigma factor [Candidatus Hydrogenedentes bacterium]|nr:sigma-70 family RNA polymerase sigma factor [Candidatus Hydrogenedentota bacterium]
MSVSLSIALEYDTGPVEHAEARKHMDARTDLDSALVARARGGDVDAFEELVRRYRNEVFAVSYHYLRNREDAWDNSQEVFLKAHRGLKRFRGESSFKTWVLRITANRCKDHFKKRRLRTVALDTEDHSHQAPSPATGPTGNLEAKELGQAIQTALEALPEKHRTAFILREYEGLSYEEMAQTIGCSTGTVMSRLHHARKKLQKILLSLEVI